MDPIQIGVGVVGGVGLWSFLSRWLGLSWRRKESEDARIRRELIEAKEAHQACEKRVDGLERRLEAVEHHHASLMPRWIEDGGKRVIWVNDAAMMQIFAPLQKSRAEVEGHTFRQLLGADVARETERLDRAALARPGSAAGTLLTLAPALRVMHVVKIAGVGRDRELIYEGYAYCVNDPEDVARRGRDRQEEQSGLSTLRQDAPGAD